METCLFCERIRTGSEVSRASDAAVAFPDGFPVADGHVLVVPRRHAPRLEDLALPEWVGLFELVHAVARELAAKPAVEGVNVGFNSGVAAGQTVEHGHVHIIPRRPGDVADPRGGVRHVIPQHADYWSGA